MLNDKVILITGASGGIGKGVAQAAVDAGAKLVLTGRDTDALDDFAATLPGDQSHYLVLPLDVTDLTQIGSTFQTALDKFNRLDGLVNNAGVFRPGPSLTVTPTDWQIQLDVNLLGVFSCCQAAARIMQHQPRGGRIVNISSNASKVGFPEYVPYSATKAAVNSITQTLAREWAELGINVNAICPGGVDTLMLTDVAHYIAEKTGEDPTLIRERLCPPQLGRQVKPVEVGRVVCFLLSDNARIIRGQSISIDGGETPF